MNCLFCKKDSSNTVSVEHIIPESLGNKDHILPRGIVCDNCNQYFALKVEKPLMELPYFRNVRHRAHIENKKGKIPIEDVLIVGYKPTQGELYIEKDGGMSLSIPNSDNAKEIFSKSGRFYMQIIESPEENCKIVSRFLAKVAVEGLLYYLKHVDGWIEEIMNKPELEEIKRYARYGSGINFWPYHQRRIYSEETRFKNETLGLKNYEVLHEFKILQTKEIHCYFVLAIMGIEYAISLGGPGTDSYKEWLIENNYKSILDDPNEIKIN